MEASCDSLIADGFGTGLTMRRRDFITLLGGVGAAWPHIARTQQSERVRVVCILVGISADMPGADAQERAFLEGLRQLGWTPGRDVRIEWRWGGGDEATTRKHAAELIALAPDVIVATGSLGAEKFIRIDASDGQASCEQSSDDAALIAAARLDPDCGDRQSMQPLDQLGPPGGVVIHRKALSVRQHLRPRHCSFAPKDSRPPL